MLKNNKIWLFCLIGLIVTACSISISLWCFYRLYEGQDDYD